ncbi:hypothetical protein HK100_009876 [Physocladia obscura]|uniref:Uncharacterized protein n=1 Tax=Physocladia obscura TaxID=109957 RepID=A0AAD5T419_9FUNG|nr:hypothetical protein HK100_009876 [Physocladia obscura]
MSVEEKETKATVARDLELSEDTEVQDINNVKERLNGRFSGNTDDPSTPTFTVRAFTIGFFWCFFLSIVNTLLSFRTNSFGIGANVALILSYPIGLVWAALLPKGSIINPGPFNVKEHALIYVFASTGTGIPYGIDNIVAQVFPAMMNNSEITIFHSIAFCLVTQFLGYGISGLVRRFLVKPTAMW